MIPLGMAPGQFAGSEVLGAWGGAKLRRSSEAQEQGVSKGITN